MSNRILVIGAGGFIGQHLVRALAGLGEHVTAVSRSNVSFDLPNVITVISELHEPDDFVSLVAQSRVVVYLASASTPGISAGHPLHELIGNVYPVASLLQVLQDRADVNLLYLSSGGALYASTDGTAADESARIQPRSYHGAGKVAAEYFISAWCSQYSGRATILRPSNVYGPGQLERTGFGIVPAAMCTIRRGETLHVWGDGSVIRDYLYIDDLVELCIAILGREMPVGARLFNACSGIGVSLNELFALMESVIGKPLKRSYEVGRVVDASRVVMDRTLSSHEYHCTSVTSLREGLEQTWAWLNSAMH